MMKHAVTGQLERYTTYTSDTHTQTILLLDLQYLQQLPFLIYQWRRYAKLSGLCLVQGMSTQSAVSILLYLPNSSEQHFLQRLFKKLLLNIV